MKSRFSAIFYPRKSEINKNGKVTIMAKITINGERVQFSTKILIDPVNWDSQVGRAKNRSDEGKNVNRHFSIMTVFVLFQTDIYRTKASRVFCGVFSTEAKAIDHAKKKIAYILTRQRL